MTEWYKLTRDIWKRHGALVYRKELPPGPNYWDERPWWSLVNVGEYDEVLPTPFLSAEAAKLAADKYLNKLQENISDNDNNQ